ncbi:hypothetical protein BG015_002080 [Linnemannia schmuckeri]|uniref:Wax synthase domain-containing protein n=1 Tax=Linnemannia schmuckeri TaxID=64567 RepID=A0A9P5S7Q0_9FUNG|nr:hypothetical protein BG015_002080 [Linnemannia schmuckeri]
MLSQVQDMLRQGADNFMIFLRTHSDLPIAHILATPWRWTTSSALYTVATYSSPTSEQLFPPHKVVSDGLLNIPLILAIVALYRMFLWPFPRSGRVKQILAFPLIVYLVIVPVLYTCPTVFFHFMMAVIAIWTVTRMIDLYYVQPWTGVPSRYYLASQTARAAALSKKTHISSFSSTKLTNGPIKTTTTTTTTSTTTTTTTTMNASTIETGDFFHWDNERLQLELWSPLRKQTGKKSSPSVGRSWIDLVPPFLVYYTIFDSIIYFLSFYTSEEVMSAPTFEYGFIISVVCSYVYNNLRASVFMNAIMYCATTGNRADPQEWTMLDTKLPLFAYSPTDFWINWHTLFRYVWVDLGFNPVKRFCIKHLGPERLGCRGSQWAREILPVYAVFFLSGAMHGYIVYALWRQNGWGQMTYFMIQATGVVVSKAIERSFVGRAIQRAYEGGSPVRQHVMKGIGASMMLVFHMATAPFFIAAYERQGMWLEVKGISLTARLFRK